MSHAVQGHSRGRIIEESSDETLSTGGGNGNHSSILVRRTPWTVWKDTKIWHQKMSPRLGDVQYATGEEQKAIFFLRGLQRVGHDLAPEQVSKTHIIHIERENSHVWLSLRPLKNTVIKTYKFKYSEEIICRGHSEGRIRMVVQNGSVKLVLLNWGRYCPQETFNNICEQFWLSQLGVCY